MTTVSYVVAVVLGLSSLGLVVAALRYLFAGAAAPAAEGYEERVAAVTQKLERALESASAAERLVARGTEMERAAETVVRGLERAAARTGADAALVVVAGPDGAPAVTSVGLAHEEATEVTRMGLPDLRGVGALEITYNPDPAREDVAAPIRSGLCVPLLDAPSMLAVLTRSRQRRFGDEDVAALREAADVVRRALETDVRHHGEHEPEMLADLLDRQSFYAACSSEIASARASSVPLALLVVHIDRPTESDRRLPRASRDELLDELARRLQRLATVRAFVCRLDGRRLGVLLSGDARAADELLLRLTDSLARDAPAGVPDAAASGGVAELRPEDGPSTLLGRAEAARGQPAGRPGTTVGTA